MRFKRCIEICERHFFARFGRINKRLKLRLIRMIGNITGINQRRFQMAPFVFVGFEFLRMKTIVEQAFSRFRISCSVLRLKKKK